MVSIRELKEYLEQESKSKKLIELDQNFLYDLVSTIKTIKEDMSKVDFETQQALSKKYGEIRSLAHKLFVKRIKKIIETALSSVITETKVEINGLPEEKLLYNELYEVLSKYWKTITMILNGEKAEQIEMPEIIYIDTNIEKFYWEDGNFYGPFEKGDIAILDKNLAEYLVKNFKKVSYL